ncbi:protein THEM6 [Gopherus evgoodei]|uniref:Protein THEM6 n=1 Tax=Gopherus evgoodei TaxID=1825980 RepID=A0A8C4YFL8_9SAUR|nr:protein THEM6 [Gopherus evgoodei]
MLPGGGGRRYSGVPPSFAAVMLLLLLGAGAALFCLLDAWFLLRLPLALLHALWLQPRLRDVLQEQSWPGLVLPSDLDWLLHMNNARYLREADLARSAYLARCGILDALRALGGSVVLAASCARHRRSLRLFERFAVRTRLLGWDGRAFYLEQRFVSPRHGFVCALLLCRLHVVGSSPGRLVQHLYQRQVNSPELPEEVQHWISYNEASSQKLRAESGLGINTKDE